MVAVPPRQGQSSSLHNIRSAIVARGAEVAAAIFAIVLYLPALRFPFVFDDHALIDAAGHPFALGGGVPYRPVRYASYWIDGALGGSAVIYHAHNVLLFALLAALVVALARRLGAATQAALLGALLLAAHPLAAEAVAYVAGRRDLLSAVFGLGAILSWIHARRGAALALLLLGAGSKESALLVAPVMMLASTCGVVECRRGDRRMLAAAAAAAVVLAVAYGAVGPWLPAPDLAGLALPGRVVAHYASHLLRPALLAPAGLSVEYPDLLSFVERVRSGEPAAMAPALLAISLTVAVALAVVTAAAAGLRGVAGAGTVACAWRFVVAWMALGAAAVAIWGGLHEPGADRHALVVMPALAIAVALALTRLGASSRRALHAICGVAVIALGAATVQQTQTWKSDVALWTHTLALQPDSARARVNLAGLLAGEGRFEEAARHLGKVLRRHPGFADAYLGRAVVRCAQRRPGAARLDLSRAQRLGVGPATIEAIGQDCPLPEYGARTRI